MNDRAISSELTPEEEEFFDAFLGAAATVQRNVTADLMQELHITLSEQGVLRLLAGVPGRRLRINELATARFVSLSRMSRLVESLRRRGLLDRQQDQSDRRAWYAVLTDAGQDWVKTNEPAYASNVRRHFLCLLPSEDLRTLTAAARRIAALPEPLDH